MKHKLQLPGQIMVEFQDPWTPQYIHGPNFRTFTLKYRAKIYCNAPTNNRERVFLKAFTKKNAFKTTFKITFLSNSGDTYGGVLIGPCKATFDAKQLGPLQFSHLNKVFLREIELPAFPKFIPDAIILSLPNSLKIKLNNGIQCRREKNKRTT